MTATDALRRLRPGRRRRTAARTSVVGATLALTLAVSGCGGGGEGTPPESASSDSPPATSPVDTLKIANAVAVDTLDPAQNAVNESIWLDQNIYARLVQTNPEGTEVVPDLADTWEISDDLLTYTFHIRDDALFADGTPVTAADAAWSIDRARDVEGGWGFLIEAVQDITAPDDQTVVVTLAQPHVPLLADLAMYAFAVLPQAAVEANPDFFTETPYGAGPFKVASLDPESQVVLTVNENYYGTAPKISTVEISVVTDDNTRVLQLQGGEVDVIENPPGNLLEQIDANPNLNVNLFDSTRVDFLQLPLKTEPLDDVQVRRAIKNALDLSEMTTLAYQGNALPASSFFPYEMLYYDHSIPVPTPDLDRARQLLSEAGYPDGFTVPLIVVSGDAAGQAQAIVIKDSLAQVGITVDIQPSELSVAYDRQRSGENGMGLRYWTNDIIDPDEVATFGASGDSSANAFNTYWEDQAVTDLVNQARSEPDSDTREQMYAQVQQAIFDQVPFLPLAYPPYRYASGTWVNGFHVSPLGNYNNSLLTLTVAEH